MMPTLSHLKISSPVGLLTLVASENHIIALLWENDSPARVKLPPTISSPRHPLLLKARQQLTEYFARKRKNFDLPLAPQGTDFQKKTWKALQTIPWGETRSYADIARKIGSPQACRAVGAANGRNPISIIVPCHRVIGRNGQLTGFAGGLKAKSWLLDFEATFSVKDRN
jgi:methylated-DNA-[protein]-cysteine S-methyltransferase